MEKSIKALEDEADRVDIDSWLEKEQAESKLEEAEAGLKNTQHNLMQKCSQAEKQSGEI